jgi:hypothetical protein
VGQILQKRFSRGWWKFSIRFRRGISGYKEGTNHDTVVK